ncbi:MAG: hypothetical protein ACRDK9_02860 [Solirubrobacterales bacterium]
MLAALGAATLIVTASLTVGQAALTLCGRREDRIVAGPVGLALLLTSSAIVAGLGGGGLEIVLALAALVVPSAVVLVRAGLPHVGIEVRVVAVVAGLAAGLAAAIPFIAAGAVGILGVGLVNDDMAAHLLLADWLEERFRPEPRLIDQGYPIGPHALVAGVGELLGARSIDVFAGLVLAIPALTAFTVSGVLEARRPWVRVLCSVLVALPYLAAAYLAQEAFKEPILALFVLGFALLLPGLRDGRGAVPLGVLAAGVVYVYSFPGLAWLAGTVVVLALAWLAGWVGGRGTWPLREPVARPVAAGGWAENDKMADGIRPTPLIAAGLAALGVLIAPEVPRLLDFVDFRALDPDRANEGGLGNLRGHLSPLEALGIWPTSSFRLSAGAGSLPAIAFYAGAAVAAVAFVLALPNWLRRHGPAIPAALLTAAVLYIAARAFGTVYTSAKALAIAAPLITLITLGGLTDPRNGLPAATGLIPRRLPALLAIAVLAGGLASSFLVLRQAPVAPESHMDELAEIRPLVEGEKLLFLGRDNFILYELRGSKPFTAVRNFYDPYYVKPNTELADVFAKFDFDSVTADTLGRFRYVLATRAAYASGPPPAYEAIAATDTYVLWEKSGPVGGRRPGETDAQPGRTPGCEPPVERVATFPRPPVVAADWSTSTVEDGAPATIELRLPAGEWELSLQYDAIRPLTLSADSFRAELPGNLDYRGATPFFAAGDIEVDRARTVTFTAAVERPPLAGRLLGSNSVAHLGTLAATAAAGTVDERARACRRYVDWYEPR